MGLNETWMEGKEELMEVDEPDTTGYNSELQDDKSSVQMENFLLPSNLDRTKNEVFAFNTLLYYCTTNSLASESIHPPINLPINQSIIYLSIHPPHPFCTDGVVKWWSDWVSAENRIAAPQSKILAGYFNNT